MIQPIAPTDPASYRRSMRIRQVRIFRNRCAYYVCPRCHSNLEREYMAYCDQCGQRLGWYGHKKAAPIYIDPPQTEGRK